MYNSAWSDKGQVNVINYYCDEFGTHWALNNYGIMRVKFIKYLHSNVYLKTLSFSLWKLLCHLGDKYNNKAVSQPMTKMFQHF